MPSSHRPTGFSPAGTLLLFGLPIALGALLLPALLLLIPSKTATIPSATTTTGAAPEQIHLSVKEWSFQPPRLQLPAGRPVTLVLDNTGQLDHAA